MSDTQPDPIFRVLLIEDDENHAFLISEALAESTVPTECIMACDGVEALQRLSEAFAARRPFDLVLMDLNLPRLDGRETLARIKQDAVMRRLPIIILTTSENPHDVAECYARGAASYITKPADLQELFDAVEQTLTFWSQVAERPAWDASPITPQAGSPLRTA